MTHGINVFINYLAPAPTAVLSCGRAGGTAGASDNVTLVVGTKTACSSAWACELESCSSFGLLAVGAPSAPFPPPSALLAGMAREASNARCLLAGGEPSAPFAEVFGMGARGSERALAINERLVCRRGLANSHVPAAPVNKNAACMPSCSPPAPLTHPLAVSCLPSQLCFLATWAAPVLAREPWAAPVLPRIAPNTVDCEPNKFRYA